mmetsp:Transcript_47188/g.86607  ORF Transcript_47188/g.86607 Transcript_47188/m.86607 type:complete len:313 (-) Transcript_47188:132-1070(-)
MTRMVLSRAATFQKHPRHRRCFAIVLSGLVLLEAYLQLTSAFASLRPHGPQRRPNTLRSLVSMQATMGPQISLDDLLQQAADEASDLDARVEEAFAGLQATDFALLSAQAESEGANAASLRLHACVQKAMDARMMQATQELNQLLSSEGDIVDNTRATLNRFDNPVPLLAVIEMNIKSSQQEGQERLEQALGFIYGLLVKEIRASVPPEKIALSQLLTTEDRNERLGKLKGFLNTEQERPVDPERLADVILEIVQQVKNKYANASGEALRGALQRIKDIATQTQAVVGKMRSDEEKQQFSIRMQPIIDLLSQ